MTEIMNPALMKAFGWTLLHSVWEISIFALILFVLLQIKKLSEPEIRYKIAVSCLFVTLGCLIFTFLYAYEMVSQGETSGVIQNVDMKTIALAYPDELSDHPSRIIYGNSNRLTEVKNWVSSHTSTLGYIWLLGVVILAIRFLGALAFTQRLKNHPQNSPLTYYQKCLEKMKAQLFMKKSIQVMASSAVKVPQVAGYFKPVILFPISIIDGLPADQIQMILAHEIAHIYRKDQWINLIQSVSEIVLFYHPAFWWMSNIIRKEREFCCDDIALALTGNEIAFAKALVTLEEYSANAWTLSLAATGPKGSLFQRIERIINPQRRQIGNNRVLASMIILIGIFTAGSSVALSHTNWLKEKSLTGNIFGSSQDNMEFEEADSALPVDGEPAAQPSKATKSVTRTAALEMTSGEAKDQQTAVISHDQLWGEKVAESYYDTLPAPPPVFVISGDSLVKTFIIDNIDDHPNPMAFSYSYSTDSVMNFHGDTTIHPNLGNVLTQFLDSINVNVTGPAVEESIQIAISSIQKSLGELDHVKLQEKMRAIQDTFDLDAIEWEAKQEALTAQREAMERQIEIYQEQARDAQERIRDFQEKQIEKMHEKRQLMDEARAERHRKDYKNVSHRLEGLLREDGFITDGEEYSFAIDRKHLRINGKKQDDDMYDKYTDFLNDYMGIDIEEGNSFSITKEPY